MKKLILEKRDANCPLVFTKDNTLNDVIVGDKVELKSEGITIYATVKTVVEAESVALKTYYEATIDLIGDSPGLSHFNKKKGDLLSFTSDNIFACR